MMQVKIQKTKEIKNAWATLISFKRDYIKKFKKKLVDAQSF